MNGDNVGNIGCGTNGTFRVKIREYLKNKINEIAAYYKNENIRDL
jgi:hypothetical protein